jgi:hypothetical protein
MKTVTVSSHVLVNTSLKTAFEYVSDLTKHPEWSGGELKWVIHPLNFVPLSRNQG